MQQKTLEVIHNNVAYWSDGDITYIPTDIKVKENIIKAGVGKAWKFKKGTKTYVCGINVAFEEYTKHLNWMMM